MKNRYNVSGRQWWLLVLWALGFILPAGAQTTQPPVIQWQRVLDLGSTSPVQGVKASSDGYAVVNLGRVVRLSESGDTRWEARLPTSSELPVYNFAEAITALPDGGFGVLVRGSSQWVLARLNADGTTQWLKPFIAQSPGGGPILRRFLNLISTSDGGFLIVGNTLNGRDGTYTNLYKFDADGNNTLSKTATTGNGARPSTITNKVIQTPDGGYLLVGGGTDESFNYTAWASKVDAQFNRIWQENYSGDEFNDVIRSPYDNNAYLAVGSIGASVTQVINIGPSGEPTGNVQTVGRKPGTSSRIVATQNSVGHTVIDVSDEDGGDLRLLKYTAPLTAIGVKIIGGSQAETIRSASATDDGGLLVVGTTTSTDGDVQGKTNNDLATWVVKLFPAAPINPPTGGTLTLTQPTYNCQTGAITFNTTGGDGSPITYSAPGITRANGTDNFGTVEQGLRNDPKPITITATQSGNTVSYVFDLAAACGTAGPVPPVLLRPVPNQTYTLGQDIGRFPIGSYFDDPTALARYRSGWQVSASGLPDGLLLEAQPSQIETTRQPLAATIYGIPTRSGVYSVTVRATTSSFPDQPVTVTFTMTITDQPVNPPTGGSLTLTAPTYNCQTGAITFNTSGGDGSPITYSAPGISRANVTDNFGTVEPGLRNDPKPITITATQSGQTASYVFDFGMFCNNAPPNGTLTLLAPTVECGSLDASFVINTSGGDGSPITYTVPGATLSSLASNRAIVSECINADNPSLSIQATQSGYTATYSLDLYRACPNTQFGQPLIARQIPDLTLSVGQNLQAYDVSPYFSDPNRFPRYPFIARYSFSATGMPAGITYSTEGTYNNVLIAKFSGTALSEPGVYTVTVVAGNNYCGPVTTSFKIIVTGTVNPPTGGTLTLTAPTYNCQTGAITFNTTGGDGSPITYVAPGISRANATDNFGTVEQGLRNDPKPITITATQSGNTVSYVFDFGAFCSGNPQPPVTPTILPPVVNGPIPAMVRRANSGRLDEPFVLSQYFSDPTPAHAGYRSNLRFSVDESAPGFFSRLPLGYFLKDLSAVEAPYAIIAGTPTLEGIYTVTVTATNLNLPPPNNSVSTTLSIQIIGRSESNPDNALRLTYPLYDCQTGVIVFNLLSRTTYNPAPIVYTAPGVILESPTSMTGIVEPGLRTNPGPITITATQNGETSQYVFDLKAHLSAYCGYVPSQPPVNPPTGGTLTLLAPDYDCGSGALTFKTSGGNGSPIEYQAVGITGWTTNPNQFVDRDSRTANDVKPFMLMARQSGQVVTYTWDLKAACGRARIASSAPEFTPTLTVLGNPVVDQLRVVIRGASGSPVRLQLTDMRGRLIENRVVEPTAGETEQVFDVSRQAPGLLVLRATSGKQVLTTKVLKR